MLLGGELASRWAAGNERRQLRAASIAYVASGILWVCVYWTHSYRVAFSLIAAASILGIAPTGPIFALMQTLSPPLVRAQASALVNLFANLVGLGLGPIVVGALSDGLQPFAGTESLRYALLFMSPGAACAAWYLSRASRSVTRDLDSAEAREPTPEPTETESCHV